MKALVRHHVDNLPGATLSQLGQFKEAASHMPRVVVNSASIAELLRKAVTIETFRAPPAPQPEEF